MALTTETTELLVEASSIQIGDLKRMTVDQYEEMARLGVLDDPRVELINGFTVRKTTQGLNHTSNYDEPEPDLAVLRGNPGDYRRRQPGPDDVGLIVEVSESSLRLDRGDKLHAYARSGIAQYWTFNLVDIAGSRRTAPLGCKGKAHRRSTTRLPARR